MTDKGLFEGFFKGITEAYHQARNLKHNCNGKVIRGRSRSIASEAEEILAVFLARRLQRNYKYYVDQRITIGKKIRYPDIMIINPNKVVIQLIEVKTDLGWGRDKLVGYCNTKYDMIKSIRGNNIKSKLEENKPSESISVSKKCSCHILIISGANIDPDTLNNQLKPVKKYQPLVYTYVLSSGVHPNERGFTVDKIQEQIQIDEEQFSFFLENIESAIM